MPWNQWQANSFPATATSASASVAPATNAGTTGQGVRLRALEASIALSAGATQPSPATLLVLDNAATLAAFAMTAPSGGSAILNLTALDLRASPGDTLTVQFAAAGPTGSQMAINIQGDYYRPGEGYSQQCW